MKCENCGAELSAEEKICSECGKEIQLCTNKQTLSNKLKTTLTKTVIPGLVTIIIISVITTLINYASEQSEKQKQSEAFNNFVSNVEQDEIEYTKGSVDEDGLYTNEWANLTFNVSSDFPQGDEELYNQLESYNTDCGYASLNYFTGKQFCLYFVNTFGLSTEIDDYVTDLSSEIIQQFKDMDINTDEYLTVSEIFDYKIAGENYRTIEIFSKVNNNYMYYCMRKQDERICMFFVADSNKEAIESTLNSIEKLR